MDGGYDQIDDQQGYDMGAPQKRHSSADDPHGFACDWGHPGGRLFEDCFKLSPCCGDPCTVEEGIYCCCLWTWCGFCAQSKLYAYSLDQECAVVNHFLPYFCVGCLMDPFLRFNLRQQQQIDPPQFTPGDFIVPLCCCPCADAQHIRSVPKEAWDLFTPNTTFKFVVEPFMLWAPAGIEMIK